MSSFPCSSCEDIVNRREDKKLLSGTRKSALIRLQSASTWSVDSLAFRTVTNKYLLIIYYPIFDILLWQPEQTMTMGKENYYLINNKT
jgi:hypothetical protein